MRWKIWSGAALILVVGFLLGWSVHPTPADGPARLGDSALRVGVSSAPAERPETVSLMLDFGDGGVRTWYDLPIRQDTDLFSLMQGLSGGDKGFAMESKPPGEYGVMVDMIGGKRNGEEGGKYWLFYVNNRMGEQSSDRTVLKPGDVVEWKFVNLKMEAAR